MSREGPAFDDDTTMCLAIPNCHNISVYLNQLSRQTTRDKRLLNEKCVLLYVLI